MQLTSEVDKLRQSVDTNESDVNANILKFQEKVHAYEEKLSDKTKLIEQVFYVFFRTLTNIIFIKKPYINVLFKTNLIFNIFV